jgi:signal transduction histidine kinase/CheY-like chemotaxis protein/HPt (histidine-containing phosphotransfer) domain-containing protein
LSLQKKIVALFLTLGVVFAVGSYAGLRAFVLPAFDEFEQASAAENLERVRRALDTDLHSLQIVNREYSMWNQTHDFVLGRRDSYIEENLDPVFWANTRINGMAFVDTSGKIVWSRLFDATLQNEMSLQAEWMRPIDAANPLATHASIDSVKLAIVRGRTTPWMVSSLPVLRSNGDGPIAGALFVIRALDQGEVARLSRETGVHLNFSDMADALLPDALRDDAPATSYDIHWRATGDQITGYQVFDDEYGEPAFVLEVSTPRTITSIGNDTIATALLFFVAATVVFLLGGWIFTRRTIVSPVGSLTEHIISIRDSGDLENSVELARSDEIGMLQMEFAGLLRKLGKAQRELEGARDQALAVSNAKSDFLAKISHEIRTPMNGVLGMIELLSNTPLDRVQKRYMHSIQESAGSLLDLLSDILDFSKIEAGKLRLENRPFDLHKFVADVADSMAGLAEKKGLRLNNILPDDPTLNVEGDPVRLRQVLTNLLGNAIKFTDRGSILLRVTADQDADDYDLVTFEVIDTGIGIAPRKHRQIFESFAQADGSTTRRFGGTGLGLAISKQLVEMMGAELCVESEPGEGARFWFTVRMRVDRKGEMSVIDQTFSHIYGQLEAEVESSQPLQGRVLVAEDNEVNQAVAVGMLESMGVEAEVVADGREAVNAFREKQFDAILMDCQMPELDGYEAAAEISALESACRRAPARIIAVTANALAGDMEKCIEAGMDDYLRKPYKSEQLHAALSKILPAGQVRQAGPSEQPLPPVFGMYEPDEAGVIDSSALDSLAALPHADNKGLVNQVIQTYINSSLDQMTRLGEAIDRADSDCIRTAAHSLKSSSANVGAVRLAELCASVETSTRASDRASAVTLQRQIKEEYPRVIEALRSRIEDAA